MTTNRKLHQQLAGYEEELRSQIEAAVAESKQETEEAEKRALQAETARDTAEAETAKARLQLNPLQEKVSELQRTLSQDRQAHRRKEQQWGKQQATLEEQCQDCEQKRKEETARAAVAMQEAESRHSKQLEELRKEVSQANDAAAAVREEAKRLGDVQRRALEAEALLQAERCDAGQSLDSTVQSFERLVTSLRAQLADKGEEFEAWRQDAATKAAQQDETIAALQEGHRAAMQECEAERQSATRAAERRIETQLREHNETSATTRDSLHSEQARCEELSNTLHKLATQHHKELVELRGKLQEAHSSQRQAEMKVEQLRTEMAVERQATERKLKQMKGDSLEEIEGRTAQEQENETLKRVLGELQDALHKERAQLALMDQQLGGYRAGVMRLVTHLEDTMESVNNTKAYQLQDVAAMRQRLMRDAHNSWKRNAVEEFGRHATDLVSQLHTAWTILFRRFSTDLQEGFPPQGDLSGVVVTPMDTNSYQRPLPFLER